MKKAFILLALSLAMISSKGQKKQNVYYLKEDGKETLLPDSADFIRIVQEPDSGETNYILQEFYKNGKLKTLGKVSYFIPSLIYEGALISFNNSGKKISSVNYKDGNKVGMGFYFFSNGKVKKQIEFLQEEIIDLKIIKDPGPLNDMKSESEGKLIYQADSSGKIYVKDGNGHLLDTTSVFENKLIQEGNYLNGYKDSVWVGRVLSGKSSFKETYVNNKLISGESFMEGKSYPYTNLMTPPQYKGGIQEFYKLLANTMRYPRDALDNSISANIIVKFFIEKDGKVINAEVARPLYPSLDAEAKRVVLSSPQWIPGKFRGLPIRVKYTIPINFNLKY